MYPTGGIWSSLSVVIINSYENCIDGVMVSILALSKVDHVFEPLSVQTKDYKIDLCCFSAKHACIALRCKIKNWLARNQDNVSQVKKHVYHQLLF
jgi:hypothetical protein